MSLPHHVEIAYGYINDVLSEVINSEGMFDELDSCIAIAWPRAKACGKPFSIMDQYEHAKAIHAYVHYRALIGVNRTERNLFPDKSLEKLMNGTSSTQRKDMLNGIEIELQTAH